MNTLLPALCQLTGWAETDSLRARVAQAAPEVARCLGLPEEPRRWLVEPGFFALLAERCAVNETYFFRHREQLEANAACLIKQFPTGRLQVWSAGCSTGEEVYSLAIALALAGAAPGRLDVLGTDLSERALAHARTAHYGAWSFRGVPSALRSRFFVAEGTGLTVTQTYRRPVHFAAHNLLGPAPLPRAHLIACRNVLIYLRPDAARVALERLVSLLVDGGLLLLGTAEQHLGHQVGLEPVLSGGVVMLRKPGVVAPQLAVAPAPALPAPPEPSLAASPPAAPPPGVPADPGQDAEAHFALATLKDADGDAPGALEHLRRALYLDPELIVAHVAQAALYARLGRERDAGRARSNALRHLKGLAPETTLRAAAPVTAGELRASLEVE